MSEGRIISVEIRPKDHEPTEPGALVCLLPAPTVPSPYLSWGEGITPYAVGVAVVSNNGEMSWASNIDQQQREAIGDALRNERCELNEWYWAYIREGVPSEIEQKEKD